MVVRTNFVFFGDQTSDPHPSLVKLHDLSKQSFVVSRFLLSSNDVLSYAVADLPPLEKARLPTFQSLLDLSRAHQQDAYKHPAVATVLLCIIQLGWFLVAAEKDPELLGGSSKTRTLGLCTGALAAVAAASISSTSELLRIAPEIIRISLRLGIAVSCRSRNLDRTVGNWAIAVSGHSLDDMNSTLEHFHSSQRIPAHKQAYISASFDALLTISGPPSTLKSLFNSSPSLAHTLKIELPITAAYHASHLDMPDVKRIIGSSPVFSKKLALHQSVVSTASGKDINNAGTISDTLHEIIADVLQRRLDWRAVMRNIEPSTDTESLSLLAIGSASATQSLQQALKPQRVQSLTEGDLVDRIPPQLSDDASGAIAIVGMSGRFPGSENLEQFWRILEEGLDLHKKVPADRFNIENHCDPTGQIKNTTLTPYGCFYDDLDLFDERLFNMSPREAAQTDPGQRLQLLTVYEALEMSGYSFDGTPSTNHSRIGTFFGQSSDDWWTVQAAQDIDTFHITGGSRAFGPGRISYHFGWEGPSLGLDAACSSSAVAIKMACSSLNARECDTALAGAANVLTGSDVFAGLSRAGFISPTGSCKTFDSAADGYCRADAVATVALKRLEDAIADRDNIQAVIRTMAVNHSAEAVSLTRPHAESQRKLFSRLLTEAGVAPAAVDYVEMHGTGTQHGDVTESISVSSVFAEGHSKERPLYVGTAKPNVGHGEATSGITSVIKGAMMFRKNIIPPHTGVKTSLNPKLPPFEELNVKIPFNKVPFHANPSGDGKRRIVVNNYNAAGGNTTLLLEDPPERPLTGLDPRTAHVVALSAKTPKALENNVKRLLDFLSRTPQVKLQDLAYTTTSRRMHHPLRIAYAIKSISELTSLLERDLAQNDLPKRLNQTPRVAFLFTGQASQYKGMGHGLFHTSKLFRQSVESSEAICKSLGFPSLINWVNDSGNKDGDFDPVASQLALVAMELGLAEFWRSQGITPNMVIGHSLGEYPALCIAGVISVADMFYLVGKRAQLMTEQCKQKSHAMLAVDTEPINIQPEILDLRIVSCEIACINSPRSTVISGPIEELELLRNRLKGSGRKASLLQVPYAFHSAQIQPILRDFKTAAQSVHFSTPSIPVASTLLGKVVTEAEIFDATYMVKQTRDTVQFARAVVDCRTQELVNDRTVWIEIGPTSLCLAMIQDVLDVPSEQLLPSLNWREEDWLTLCKGFAGVYKCGIDVNWKAFHQDYESELLLLNLPSYGFDYQSHWIQYEGDWSISKCHRQADALSTMFSPSLSSTTLHHVQAEMFSDGSASVTFTTNLSEEKLRAAILGHRVNGSGLVSSSIVADMAYTAASYVWSRVFPTKGTQGMEISKMQLRKPLIANSDAATHLISVISVLNKDSNCVEVSLRSPKESEEQIYAHCYVYFRDENDWRSSWAKQAYLFQTRMDHLMLPANAGTVDRMSRTMVYKLFSTHVEYDNRYQGIMEAFVDSEMLEATAKVQLQSSGNDGDFAVNPYWHDSLIHLAGFVLNGTQALQGDNVFLCQGWESMRITDSLSTEKCLQVYVRMQPVGARGVMVGDVHVFEGDEIIAVVDNLRFQPIRKNILHSLIPGSKPQSQSPQTPTSPASIKSISPVSRSSTTVTTDTSIFSKDSAAPLSASSSSVSFDVPSQYNNDVAQFKGIIAKELGVQIDVIQPHVHFADLGLDSLLGLSIIATVKAETGRLLPSSFFLDYLTLEEAMKSLGLCNASPKPPQPIDKLETTLTVTQCHFPTKPESYKDRAAVVLRESSFPNAPTLFVLPDGSGSASSYIELANCESRLKMIGLNSPFLLCRDMKFCSVQEVANNYVKVIIKEQKHGPYFLAGWSIGGTYAFEVAKILVAMGQEVKGLILIDAPCAARYPPLPLATVEILENIGVLQSPSKNNSSSFSLRQNFARCIDQLNTYRPTPWDSSSTAPKTLAIWARQGVWESLGNEASRMFQERFPIDNHSPLDTKTHAWLMDGRKNYSPDGWEELMPQVECDVIDANHFSIMKKPEVQTLSEILNKAVDGFYLNTSHV